MIIVITSFLKTILLYLYQSSRLRCQSIPKNAIKTIKKDHCNQVAFSVFYIKSLLRFIQCGIEPPWSVALYSTSPAYDKARQRHQKYRKHDAPIR